jgi:hypothetical protein
MIKKHVISLDAVDISKLTPLDDIQNQKKQVPMEKLNRDSVNDALKVTMNFSHFQTFINILGHKY